MGEPLAHEGDDLELRVLRRESEHRCRMKEVGPKGQA